MDKKLKKEKAKGIVKEFTEFIHRGNVVDMAVGIIVGSAFTAIVNSMVKDIFNPVIGLLTGGIDFGNLKLVIKAASEGKEALTINYGAFVNSIINFLLIALVVFWLIKFLNMAKEKVERNKKKEEQVEKTAEPAEPPADIKLLTEIRDLLKK